MYQTRLSAFCFISIILASVLLYANVSPVLAYWDPNDPDCEAHHGIGQHNATYVPDANIVLDGVANESAWYADGVTEYKIPTATIITSSYFFKSYVYLKYVYDDQYLYIRAIWNDTTYGDPLDMISFCWNINATDFSVGIFVEPNVMATVNENETMDCWKWAVQTNPNGSSYKIQDACYGYDGWFPHNSEYQNVESGYTYATWMNNTECYLVELRRALTTGDSYDFQLNENGVVRFCIAVMDGLGAQDHAVSWTYELHFDHLESTSSPDPTLLILGGVAAIGVAATVIVIFVIRKRPFTKR